MEELAARCNATGPDALGDQHRRNGRTATLLTEEALSALAERVRTPPAEGGVWSGLKVAVAQVRAAHPGRPVEVWAEDERRLGLKPIRRRVWAPVGQRPLVDRHFAGLAELDAAAIRPHTEFHRRPEPKRPN